VILANMNEDVISKDLNQFFMGLQLVEAISFLHSQSLMPTHQRGSKAIDGIYLSQALLEHAKGGILPLGLVTSSDHQAVWLDLRAEHIEMHQQDPVTRLQCWHLKCQDPWIIQRNNKTLTQALVDINVDQ